MIGCDYGRSCFEPGSETTTRLGAMVEITLMRTRALIRLGRRLQGLGRAVEFPGRLRRRFAGIRVDEDVLAWASRPYVAKRGVHAVVDVGANVGQFARAALLAFPKAVVHSFEPLPAVFEELEKMATDNESRGRLHTYRTAVGSSLGAAIVRQAAFSPASSILPDGKDAWRATDSASPHPPKPVEVSCTTLDVWSASAQLELPILLKLDVQGYEANVLRGATRLLQKVDFVLIEVANVELYERMATFATLASILEPYGLRYLEALSVVRESDTGLPLWQDVVFGRIE